MGRGGSGCPRRVIFCFAVVIVKMDGSVGVESPFERAARTLKIASVPSRGSRASAKSIRPATRCCQASSMIPVALGHPTANAVGCPRKGALLRRYAA